jgi:hypothetical protein
MSDDLLNSCAASYTFQFVFLFMSYMLLSVCISSDSFNKRNCTVPGCKVCY